MLKKIRISLAVIFYVLITLLFLDFTGTLHGWLGWMAKIQLLPAVLAHSIGILLFLFLLTLLFGRIYCSVICPLGVFQDMMAWMGRRGKKLPYSFSPAKSWLRYGILGLCVAAMIFGVSAVVSLLDPYAAYGRIAGSFFLPVWQWGNNLLAVIAERVDSYAFYTTEIWIKSVTTLIVAAATWVVVAVLAWRNGRTYCNTICPVGTLLGLLSRNSLFQIKIDEQKCKNCNICARYCKAACIDYKELKVDHSRCVLCMNCIGKCTNNAIVYTRGVSPKTNEGRKRFLATSMVMATSALQAQIIPKATDIKVDGGLADILDKKSPRRLTPLTPAGSKSARHMKRHCTACQLCVTVCSNGVLRPSTSLETFMQPQMSYERGYCRPECVKCSEICPSGAIKRTSKEEKSSTQIGHAVWVRERCIPLTDAQPCSNCERHCPTKAITMVPSVAGNEESLKIPTVNEELCIGCGACEYLCPSRPLSAIYVEGHQMHRII
ncbi:MAG: 4Fe-4S binding protein [Bacteroidales bacterium]|nr:4Fe-4S binding protein [Bacteroidales bacterium]